jgi:outer membrane receptor protein involved in Fe transport
VAKRQFLNNVQKGDIRETNGFVYMNQDIELSDKWNLNAGLRYDIFLFQYRDGLKGSANFSRQAKGIVSPKINLTYTPGQKIKFYLNNGVGFHSNDTRLILNSGAKNILPKVFATDLGAIIKPGKNLIIKTALWHLYSQQEFVYVGDEGIVEAGGKTRRMGMDFSARYQFSKWLFGDLDINLTEARALGIAKGENYISLAPSFTSIGGLTVKAKNGFSGSLRYRFIGKRPASEDYSVAAQGYFIAELLLAYKWKKWELKISGENIFDVNWREAQFNTESRLQSEADPVTEIHYTPGTPRFLKAGISFQF